MEPDKYIAVRLPQLLAGRMEPRTAVHIARLEAHQIDPRPIPGLDRLAAEPRIEGRVVILARNGLRLAFRNGLWRVE